MSISETFTGYYIDENGLLCIPDPTAHSVRTVSYADTQRLLTMPEVLPDSLNYLGINYCAHVDRLPSLPEGLRSLHIVGTGVSELPKLPPRLGVLGMSGTKITSLPALLPQRLTDLGISMTKGIRHVNLPAGIESFVASGSDMEGVVEIGENIMGLDLSYTKVTDVVMITVSERMVRLDVSHSLVTEVPIPAYGPYMTYLNISFTGISQLGELSDSLKQLDVRHTNIPSETIDALAAERPNLIIIR